MRAACAPLLTIAGLYTTHQSAQEPGSLHAAVASTTSDSTVLLHMGASAQRSARADIGRHAGYAGISTLHRAAAAAMRHAAAVQLVASALQSRKHFVSSE